MAREVDVRMAVRKTQEARPDMPAQTLLGKVEPELVGQLPETLIGYLPGRAPVEVQQGHFHRKLLARFVHDRRASARAVVGRTGRCERWQATSGSPTSVGDLRNLRWL